MAMNNIDDVQQLINQLFKYVNVMTPNHTFFVERVLSEHRTLQQQLFEMMLHVIKAWSELPNDRYDMRNKYTVEKCREIMKIFECGVVTTPFI